MADVADYDAAEVTEREQLAADHLTSLSEYNAQSTLNQLKQQLANYDQADRQNRELADRQLYQNSQKARDERFAAQKKLQAAAQSLFGSAGNALRGSTLYGMNDMLRTRQDLDNNDVWTTLRQNQNTVENAYQESLNQNALSRNDALSSAEYALRGLRADMAAQLNNINPSLFKAPEDIEADIQDKQYDANKNTGAVYGTSQSKNPYHQQTGSTSAQHFYNTENPVRRNQILSGYMGSLLNRYNSGLS